MSISITGDITGAIGVVLDDYVKNKGQAVPPKGSKGEDLRAGSINALENIIYRTTSLSGIHRFAIGVYGEDFLILTPYAGIKATDIKTILTDFFSRWGSISQHSPGATVSNTDGKVPEVILLTSEQIDFLKKIIQPDKLSDNTTSSEGDEPLLTRDYSNVTVTTFNNEVLPPIKVKQNGESGEFPTTYPPNAFVINSNDYYLLPTEGSSDQKVYIKSADIFITNPTGQLSQAYSYFGLYKSVTNGYQTFKVDDAGNISLINATVIISPERDEAKNIITNALQKSSNCIKTNKDRIIRFLKDLIQLGELKADPDIPSIDYRDKQRIRLSLEEVLKIYEDHDLLVNKKELSLTDGDLLRSLLIRWKVAGDEISKSRTLAYRVGNLEPVNAIGVRQITFREATGIDALDNIVEEHINCTPEYKPEQITAISRGTDILPEIPNTDSITIRTTDIKKVDPNKVDTPTKLNNERSRLEDTVAKSKDTWGVRFSKNKTARTTAFTSKSNSNNSRTGSSATEIGLGQSKRDNSSAIVGAEVDSWYFTLLPAIRSQLPVQGGMDVPGASPGLNFKIVPSVAKHKMIGFQPAYQHLGIDTIMVTMVGAMVGGDGAQPKYMLEEVDSPYYTKGLKSLAKIAQDIDTYKDFNEFYKFAVLDGKELEIEVNINKSRGGTTIVGADSDTLRDSKTGNMKFKGLVKRLEISHAREDRTWYILDIEITDSGLVSKESINLTNDITELVNKSRKEQLKEIEQNREEKIVDLIKQVALKEDKNSKIYIWNLKNKITGKLDPDRKLYLKRQCRTKEVPKQEPSYTTKLEEGAKSIYLNGGTGEKISGNPYLNNPDRVPDIKECKDTWIVFTYAPGGTNRKDGKIDRQVINGDYLNPAKPPNEENTNSRVEEYKALRLGVFNAYDAATIAATGIGCAAAVMGVIGASGATVTTGIGVLTLPAAIAGALLACGGALSTVVNSANDVGNNRSPMDATIAAVLNLGPIGLSKILGVFKGASSAAPTVKAGVGGFGQRIINGIKGIFGKGAATTPTPVVPPIGKTSTVIPTPPTTTAPVVGIRPPTNVAQFPNVINPPKPAAPSSTIKPRTLTSINQPPVSPTTGKPLNTASNLPTQTVAKPVSSVAARTLNLSNNYPILRGVSTKSNLFKALVESGDTPSSELKGLLSQLEKLKANITLKNFNAFLVAINKNGENIKLVGENGVATIVQGSKTLGTYPSEYYPLIEKLINIGVNKVSFNQLLETARIG